jgi:hypothetical protein
MVLAQMYSLHSFFYIFGVLLFDNVVVRLI